MTETEALAALAAARATINAAHEAYQTAYNTLAEAVAAEEPPMGSIVMDTYTRAWQNFDNTWYIVAGGLACNWVDLNADHGPITLVFNPDEM